MIKESYTLEAITGNGEDISNLLFATKEGGRNSKLKVIPVAKKDLPQVCDMLKLLIKSLRKHKEL